MFATDHKQTEADFYLKGNPASLIATNVPSIMGGKSNPWEARKDGMAVIGS